jgi:hypothetical protein
MISTDGERGESNSELGESGTWVTCSTVSSTDSVPSPTSCRYRGNFQRRAECDCKSLF